MAAAPTSSPAAALLAVALVWSLLVGTRALRLRGSAGDAAVLLAVGVACAALLARRPTGPARRSRPTPLVLAAGAAGFASFPLWLAAIGGVGLALGLGPPPPVRAPGLLLAVVQLGPGPLLEELLYRERLLGALRPRLGTAGAIAASSALFAAAHPEPWSALAGLGVGLALGALFAATGSLALAAAAHAGLNTAACLWALGLG